DGVLLATLGAGTTMTVVTGLTAATSYDFEVVAFDNDGLETEALDVTVVTPDWVPATVGMFNPATGQWHLMDEEGNIHTFYYGNPGDIPMMGDWDCDGIDTVGLYRQSTGFAYIRNSNDQGNAD